MKPSTIQRCAACFLLGIAAIGVLAGPPDEHASAPASAAVTAKPITPTQLKHEVEANAGKVVLVNFWATWCPPCVGEFPDLVKLYDKYGGKDFTLISVSVDDVADNKKKVAPFLTKQKARFPTFINSQSDVDKFVSFVDKSWDGPVPRTYILDRSGRVRKVITGAIDPKAVDTLIAKLKSEPVRAVSHRPTPNGFLAPT